jgi:hypothetical protein
MKREAHSLLAPAMPSLSSPIELESFSPADLTKTRLKMYHVNIRLTGMEIDASLIS